MAQKRERDLINNNNYEPPCKKRRNNNNNNKSSSTKKEEEKKQPWENSFLFKNNNNFNTVDKKQYNKIFTMIKWQNRDNKKIIPLVIINKITDYSVGNLVACWNTKCREQLSFLQSEKFKKNKFAQKCQCGIDQYLSVCKICNGDCTAAKNDKDFMMFCNECYENFLCHDHLNQCCECHVWWCSDCWDLKKHQMYCYKCINKS